MVLNFTAEGINAIEEENGGQPFYVLMNSPRTKMLARFVQAGLGLTDIGEAFTAIDKYYKEEKGDVKKLLLLIVKDLQDDGFLPREVDLKKEINKAMNSIKDYVPPTKPLANNGKTGKSTPSDLVLE